MLIRFRRVTVTLMNTHESSLDELVTQVRANTFVNQGRVDDVLAGLSKGRFDSVQARKWLRALDEGVELGPGDISSQQVDTEWVALLDGMTAEASTWRVIAGSQFRQAYFLLPAAVIFLFISAVGATKWLHTPVAVVSPLAAACLACLAAHAFFVFRIQQQAGLAAERLSEKRAAILFLRVAVGRSDSAERAQILSAGTAMFLGHQTAATVPLTAEDRQAFLNEVDRKTI